jgi:hypothetical protein
MAELTDLVATATKAQSPHNTQAWKFVVTDSTIEVHADWDRNLSVSDPDGREMVIGCGAAVEHLLLLLGSGGHAVTVEVTAHDPRPTQLARIELGTGEPYVRRDELVAAIPRRHTNRTAYRSDPVDPDILDALQHTTEAFGVGVHRVDDPQLRQAVTTLIMTADRQQMADSAFRHELSSWMRRPHTAATDGMFTNLLGQHGLAAELAPLAVRTFDVGKGQAARDGQLVEGSPHLWVLYTGEDTPAWWLATGRALAHLTLAATHHGVAHAYMNQPCELPDVRVELADTLGCNAYPQLIVRMGHADPTELSPRRPVDEVLITAGAD